MQLYNSQTYMNDLDAVVQYFPWLSQFRGKSIMITGGTGLIGSCIADVLLRTSELNEGSIKVIVAGRDREKVMRRFSYYAQKSYFAFCSYDATKIQNFDFNADYIIHAASNAYPAIIQEYPVETMESNFNGMLNLLRYAKAVDVKHCVFVSSSEIYGKKPGELPIKEDEMGFIDLLDPRSSYSISKRAAETLCASFSYEQEISVSIVRPGHIYGPTASEIDNRVSSYFPYQVLEGKDLILKSDGSQIRSYCYVLDCATAILKVLLSGKSREAYNISNPQSIMSIKELATLFAQYGNVKLRFEIPTQSERAAFNPMTNSALNSDKLLSLGWRGLFDKEKGIVHTLKILLEASASDRGGDQC